MNHSNQMSPEMAYKQNIHIWMSVISDIRQQFKLSSNQIPTENWLNADEALAITALSLRLILH